VAFRAGPDALRPAVRLVFGLHDMFAVPFDEIAAVVGRSPEATRQLASRARRRVRTAELVPDVPPGEQRAMVEAFHEAAREGDFGRLVALLDPDVVLRVDFGAAGASQLLRGAEAVASQAGSYAQLGLEVRPVLVNGVVGMVTYLNGAPFSLGSMIVRNGRIVEMDILA